MHHGASSFGHTRATGEGEQGGRPMPRLLCLAATERDRRDVAAILASSALDQDAGEPVGLEAIAAISASRRAVLAGPDAVAAIVQGGGTSASGGMTIIDVMTSGVSSSAGLHPAAPPAADAAPMHDGLMVGSSRRRSEPAEARVPTGPLAALATEHDRRVLASLTPREAEVAELVGSGSNVGEIAATLGREKTTVISHRRSLLRKIGCREALGIARFAYRTGLATP